ncbi:MAG: hypothetical protein ACYSSO_14090 [Planctomycetota bacterium]
MCDKENDYQKCQVPESLKAKTTECTPDQITHCHGDVEGTPLHQSRQVRVITGQGGLLTIPESPVRGLFGLAVALSRNKR